MKMKDNITLTSKEEKFIERLVNTYEYIENPARAIDDLKEYADTIMLLSYLLQDKEKLNNIDPFDLCDLIIAMKKFSNDIKPFCINYGIIPELDTI